MSLIRNWNATPNRICIFLDFIKTTKNKYTKQDLENIFTPQSSSFFKEIFQIMEMLDFITIQEDIVIYTIENKKKSNLEIIKNAIFTIDNIKINNFNLALSWLLVQKPQDIISFSSTVGNKIIKDLTEHTDELELTNTSSWQQFIYWCEYLGFVNKISISGETFISPDPTIAVKEELKVNFKKNITLTIKDFLIKLSANLPVLEYGYVRKKIEPMLRDDLVLPIDTLSYSTSLAMLRLEQQNIIALDSKSDADIITLQDGINNRRISHIRYLGQ